MIPTCARCGHEREDHNGFGTHQPCNHYGIEYDDQGIGQRVHCVCHAYVELPANPRKSLALPEPEDEFERRTR